MGRRKLGIGTSIEARLVFAVAVPCVVVVVLLGTFAWQMTRSAVQASLVRELTAQVALAASTLSPASARVLLPGDEDTRTAKRLVARLRAIASTTGSARARIVDEDELVRADSDGAIAIGGAAPRIALDRAEFQRALAGTPAVTVPFSVDGQPFLAAYARLPEPKDDDVVTAPDVRAMTLVLEAPAGALAAVSDVARAVALLVSLAVLAVVLLSVVVARTITGPLRALSSSAQGLAHGDLNVSLPTVLHNDEVGELSRTLESMRAALLDRDAERQMMLAGIAHEVRNPLGGMELFSGLLEEGLQELPASTERDELASHAARVRRELVYLTGVVNDFLAFARDTPIVREPVEVTALLHDVESLCARESAPTVTVLPGPALVFPLDRSRIKQALLNLVENAIAATPSSGQVTLSAAVVDDELVLRVTDNGKGMDAATVARAFAPFFTTREKGSGLGLPLVRKLARDHGGDATLTSSPGAGTTVTLTLRARLP